MTLKEFEVIYRRDVAPLYTKNQSIFDQDGIHGCLHISRSLIISRLIHNILKQSGINTNIEYISYAVAFHDSGRKSNGKDIWENDSRLICRDYLISKNIPNSDYISSLIVKEKSKENDYNYLVCHDTDVLEIIRPTTGIGLANFDSKHLKLNINYSPIMNEVFTFILETEGMNKRFQDEHSLFNLMLYLMFKSKDFPMLYAAANT